MSVYNTSYTKVCEASRKIGLLRIISCTSLHHVLHSQHILVPQNPIAHSIPGCPASGCSAGSAHSNQDEKAQSRRPKILFVSFAACIGVESGANGVRLFSCSFVEFCISCVPLRTPVVSSSRRRRRAGVSYHITCAPPHRQSGVDSCVWLRNIVGLVAEVCVSIK